jgi:hypothetical protein
MPWTVFRPNFKSCQVEPMTYTSYCTLPNSYMRAGCHMSALSNSHMRASCLMSALPNLHLRAATTPVLVILSLWWIFLYGLDSPASSPCLSNNLHCWFSLTNLQLHKYALPIYPTVGMTVSTLRHCFGQPTEVCTSCTFDIVTTSLIVLANFMDSYQSSLFIWHMICTTLLLLSKINISSSLSLWKFLFSRCLMIKCLILVSDLRPKLIFDTFYIGGEYLPENNDKYMCVCFL